MNCMDLLAVATVVGLGLSFGKCFFDFLMKLADWVMDKTAHHRIVAFLLIVAILIYLTWLFSTTVIPIGNVLL